LRVEKWERTLASISPTSHRSSSCKRKRKKGGAKGGGKGTWASIGDTSDRSSCEKKKEEGGGEGGKKTLASMRDTSDRSSSEKTSGSWSKSPLLMRLKMS
jgi:hypothetical protein